MNFQLNVWLRAIRYRFLAASAIGVSCGLALAIWANPSQFSILNSVLIYLGVFCLHSSVDLLNDYFDFKRGIDLRTKKTKFSGGTGVLPEGLLTPRSVYLAGIVFLLIGLTIGGLFVILKGYIIGIILCFAAISIVLYSTKLVDLGLGELFVGIKGTLIVIGTFYIQTSLVSVESIGLGVVAGLLSSMVLFINSIPDIKADREGGRRTLAIILDVYDSQAKFYFVMGLIMLTYLSALLFFNELDGNILSILPVILVLPLALKILVDFKRYLVSMKGDDESLNYVLIMRNAVLFSRLFGVALILGIIIVILNNIDVVR
ncbi:prenyltransferase [Candidatus Nitrosocosmicus franklandus]|uniref:prenyltransferase n=1 Tax=Candidatus Nitrosocosmicus franklandianus TaxID=1798806 RepID=UPI00106AD22E|nr:prenyltransferase [Candidatus Nitrosocosmicus franklandus]